MTAVALPVLAADGEHWAESALCREVDPELFHPLKGGSNRPAKKICHQCVVRGDCLRWAVATDTRDGILGGLSPRERRGLTLADVDLLPPVVVEDVVIPAGRPIPVVPLVRPRPIPEPRPVPDVDDQAPPAVVKKTRAKVAACGTLSGYSRHRKAGEPACEPCNEARRVYQRAHPRVKPPAPERKPAVQVLWLLPAVSGPERLEYATLSWSATRASKWSLISPETAAILMGQGEEVHARTVTAWQPVTGGTQ